METWYDALQVFLAVCACLIPIFLLYSKRLRKQPTDQTKAANSKAYSKCSSPNCVRCQNYGELNDKLTEKFHTLSQTIAGDLSRIKKAIDGENKTDKKFRREAKQQPNIFFLPGLSLVTPLYTGDAILGTDAEIIRNNNSNILQEFLEVFDNLQNGDATGWLSNSVPTGDWFVFHLYNQGVRMPQNCERCPITTEILEKDLRRFMKGNAFGNAAFSVLQPRTHITEHFGPCNVRIRCHLGLLTPPNCWLKVDGVQHGWTQGQCLLFDDSFRHEAKHGGSTEPRAVFIVDLWHPDINEAEITCLNKLFCLD